ncbi:acyl-CoA dehydrogenase family protein [Herbaspirillum rubrisubalbicans]|uniref:Acyl-CoA dehydrogenase n=1 Tax=Herbaspirillum rubrisubalbicans Os34 TaxID=1235827 RepID=A0A6M3ZT80_9BURK|nr:acyl-CoA dehydrogenase family protein [Herbaspirillum rubrisubalbicans]QJQ01463.1 acyl-CoA dehydrogenase [Herbaspirillum rubrisubalbicans Os34]
MDFNLTQEQQMLRDGAERFLREAYDFDTRCAIAREPQAFRASMWQQFADLGWLALELPEDAGGLGLGFVDSALLIEAMGRAMVLEPYLHSAVLCTRIVDRSGVEALRSDLLPRLADGSALLALADSEAGSRFRVGCTARTTAQRTADGYRIDGAKMLVMGAAVAGQLLVTAGLDGACALFLVDAGASGVTRTDYRVLDGARAADIAFDGARATLMLADAMPVLEEAVDRATLGTVAQMLGVMEAVMEITAEYIKTRVQFGQPIGKFQALQHRMAEMFVEVQETRSILIYGMSCLDKAPNERRKAVSAAKAVAGQAARFVCGQGIQLHGGVGMTEEYQIGHYFRAMTMLEKLFGDTDHHLGRFAAVAV